jgi:hypothetical protein
MDWYSTLFAGKLRSEEQPRIRRIFSVLRERRLKPTLQAEARATPFFISIGGPKAHGQEIAPCGRGAEKATAIKQR